MGGLGVYSREGNHVPLAGVPQLALALAMTPEGDRNWYPPITPGYPTSKLQRLPEVHVV